MALLAFILRKMLAFEYNVVNEIGECVFYAEYKSKNSIDKSYISTFTVSHQNIFNFIFLSIDFESKVSEILNSLDNNINSSIVKDSIDETQIYAKLTQLKDAYLSEMAQLESTEKANIVTNTLFTTKIFLTDEMNDIGITSTNAFAEALLNNTRGDGYDKVTGWTMDDVVATYVGEFSDEAIDYSSGVNFLIITKNAILNYRIWTQRAVGDTRDRYSMILNNSADTGVTSVTTSAEFSENAVIFTQDGIRISG